MSIASIGLTDRQRRALAGIGIDVWVRRDIAVVAPVPVVADLREVTRRPERSKPPLVVRSETAPVAAAELRIALDCIAADGVVVVCECANALERRFVHDIVLAIAGTSVSAHKSQFRWPQTQTGDSSAAAARNAYRAFLRGQIERSSARWLLLFGATAQLLVDLEVNLGPETMRLPDIRAMRSDPNGKKQLWLSVSQRNRA